MISSGLRRSANGAILKRYVSRDIPSRGAALLRRSSAAGHRQLKPRKKSTLALSSSTTSTPMSNSQLTQGLTWTQMKAVLISSAIPMGKEFYIEQNITNKPVVFPVVANQTFF